MKEYYAPDTLSAVRPRNVATSGPIVARPAQDVSCTPMRFSTPTGSETGTGNGTETGTRPPSSPPSLPLPSQSRPPCRRPLLSRTRSIVNIITEELSLINSRSPCQPTKRLAAAPTKPPPPPTRRPRLRRRASTATSDTRPATSDIDTEHRAPRVRFVRLFIFVFFFFLLFILHDSDSLITPHFFTLIIHILIPFAFFQVSHDIFEKIFLEL